MPKNQFKLNIFFNKIFVKQCCNTIWNKVRQLKYLKSKKMILNYTFQIWMYSVSFQLIEVTLFQLKFLNFKMANASKNLGENFQQNISSKER